MLATETKACRVCLTETDAFRPQRRTCLECERKRSSHYYAQNKQRYAVHNRAWYERNRTKSLERSKARRQAVGRDALKADLQEWRIANRDRVRATGRADAARRRARMLAAPLNTATRDLIAARWDYFAGLCWMCGAAATAMDHVKPLAAGGSHCPSNLRPACRPCNSAKGARWPGATGLSAFVAA